ncbi:hypothetical protein L2E82_18172 [Cichorium intybus]|uniref:Uncharacterized protein n=1 Tax=Cichorium intybus TaxID=13427 RepID=A0ACB9FAS7_CICIN|nr:hypothetical protein L2E82_18172 [Cichorium intybus]
MESVGISKKQGQRHFVNYQIFCFDLKIFYWISEQECWSNTTGTNSLSQLYGFIPLILFLRTTIPGLWFHSPKQPTEFGLLTTVGPLINTTTHCYSHQLSHPALLPSQGDKSTNDADDTSP